MNDFRQEHGKLMCYLGGKIELMGQMLVGDLYNDESLQNFSFACCCFQSETGSSHQLRVRMGQKISDIWGEKGTYIIVIQE